MKQFKDGQQIVCVEEFYVVTEDKKPIKNELYTVNQYSPTSNGHIILKGNWRGSNGGLNAWDVRSFKSIDDYQGADYLLNEANEVLTNQATKTMAKTNRTRDEILIAVFAIIILAVLVFTPNYTQ